MGGEEGGRPSAIAPRGAEATDLGLNDDNPERRVDLEKRTGRPQSSEPSAHDGHIDIKVPRQRGTLRHLGAKGVPPQ